jgi:hypothetical protein
VHDKAQVPFASTIDDGRALPLIGETATGRMREERHLKKLDQQFEESSSIE